MVDFKEVLSVTLILFSVIDILGSIPIIISVRKKVGHVQSEKATIVSGILMIIFLFLGEAILSLFGLDISSFAVAGAFVMFLIGVEMVLGLQIFRVEKDDLQSHSVMPIAFPLIAGAGTMTTLITLKAEYDIVNILIGVVINLIFVYIVLKSSTWLEKKLGNSGFNILRKVFGIILLAIAIKLFKNHWFI